MYSLADRGLYSLADRGFYSLADRGVYSLADRGVYSLADGGGLYSLGNRAGDTCQERVGLCSGARIGVWYIARMRVLRDD